MPAAMQARLLPFLERRPAHATRLLAIPVSVFAGAVTHLLWDSFTHLEAPAVAAFPVLQKRIVTVSDYDVCVFQRAAAPEHHARHPAARALDRALVRERRSAADPARALPVSARWMIVAGIVAGAAIVALVVALPSFPAPVTLQDLQPFAWRAVTTGSGLDRRRNPSLQRRMARLAAGREDPGADARAAVVDPRAGCR